MRLYGQGSVLGVSEDVVKALAEKQARDHAEVAGRQLDPGSDSVMNRLGYKISWLSDVTNRLEAKMDYIDGPRPSQTGNAEKVQPAMGALDSLDASLAHFLERLSSQVARLERIVG